MNFEKTRPICELTSSGTYPSTSGRITTVLRTSKQKSKKKLNLSTRLELFSPTRVCIEHGYFNDQYYI